MVSSKWSVSLDRHIKLRDSIALERSVEVIGTRLHTTLTNLLVKQEKVIVSLTEVIRLELV